MTRNSPLFSVEPYRDPGTIGTSIIRYARVAGEKAVGASQAPTGPRAPGAKLTSESANVAGFLLVSRPLTSQSRRPSGARTTRPQFRCSHSPNRLAEMLPSLSPAIRERNCLCGFGLKPAGAADQASMMLAVL